MSDLTGWIKYHRKIEESAIYKNPVHFQRWLWLISHAAFKDTEVYVKKTNQYITIKRGQVWETTRGLATAWGCSRGAVTRFLQSLKNQKMIQVRVEKFGTLITIDNYCIYQASDVGTEDTERTKGETTDGPVTDHRRGQLEEVKNSKNVEEAKMIGWRGVLE